MTFKKGASWKAILKGRGFYVTLGICAVALGVVAAVTLFYVMPRDVVQKEEEGGSAVTTTAAPTAASTTAQAAQIPLTNVADMRTTTVATTTTATTAAPQAAPQDLYVLPLTNEVCARFSAGQPVYSATMGDWRTHNGVDFAGSAGQTVKAAADGTVRAVFTDVLWGDVMEIDHGFGIVTRYCGVSARHVAVGDSVTVGEEIGVLSAVPCEASEGEHLHFEILSGSEYLDAVEVIGVEVRYSGAAAQEPAA